LAKKKWPFKDPDEIIDYMVKWGTRLGIDTILTVTWTITGPDSSLIKTAQSNDATNAVIWLSGGTLSQTYAVLCHITTAAARTMEQTVYIKIKAK
jgi:hypothetical protein